MITKQQHESVLERCAQMLQQAGIVLTPEERAHIEVAEFGLGELEKTGLEIIVYVNTERVCQGTGDVATPDLPGALASHAGPQAG